MKRILNHPLAFALVMFPTLTHAHPGHGHGNPYSPGHYLGNPVHAWPLALTLAIAAIALIWQWSRSTGKK